MIFIFSIIAGLQYSVSFILYSKMTQSHIHIYILFLTLYSLTQLVVDRISLKLDANSGKSILESAFGINTCGRKERKREWIKREVGLQCSQKALADHVGSSESRIISQNCPKLEKEVEHLYSSIDWSLNASCILKEGITLGQVTLFS